MAAPETPLTVEVISRPGGVAVRLLGSATMERCEQLNASLIEAAADKPGLMVLDLSGLEFICSLGLGSIVAAYLRAAKYNGKVVLTGPAEAVRELLDLTRLDHLLPVYGSIDAAFASESPAVR